MVLKNADNSSMPDALPSPVVDFDHLQVAYNDNLVLHGITAAIDPGQCVAITGSNGSGKSTLIKACLGIAPVTGGTVSLFGQQVAGDQAQPRRVAWNRVGYVPQRMSVGGGVGATVREVVETGLLGARRWWIPRSGKHAVDDALERVGLTHRAADSFQVLSGGQQQRALIARALVRDPQLYLLDEPLTGLDQHNREVLAEIIGSAKRSGATLLIVLHELGELAPLIDRELQVKAGHVVHDGPCTHLRHENPHHHLPGTTDYLEVTQWN